MKNKKNNTLREADWLKEDIGNNAFGYAFRGPNPQIFLPDLMTGSIDDISTGKEVVFEEYNKEIISCKGLEHHIYTELQINDKNIPVYIFDNHNWAFLYWWKYISSHNCYGIDVIHIDQHSDMREPQAFYNKPIKDSHHKDILEYTTKELNVGNFIIPALKSNMIGSVRQVTGSTLEGECEYIWSDQLQKIPPRIRPSTYILDIDIDYFASEMNYFSNQAKEQTLHEWIQDASCITIATSPFFIDQKKAIDIIQDIFTSYKKHDDNNICTQ